jgi:restriction system protein
LRNVSPGLLHGSAAIYHRAVACDIRCVDSLESCSWQGFRRFAFQIPPSKWEEIIAGAYSKAGFDEVTLTPRSGDFGRDVIAVKRGLRVIDQVKAYSPENLVTADDVRALIGVLHGDGASKGFLTTTSDFAPRLRTDPLILPFMPSRLELIDGKALITRLDALAKMRR